MNKEFNGIEINPVFDDLNEPSTILNHIEELKAENPKVKLSRILESAKVSASEHIEPPKIAFEQIDEIGESAILGTLGNISMIIGKAKSRKSFFVNIAVSAVLKEDTLLGRFTGRLPIDKSKVLYFDTEQSKYHVQLALKRICQQINVSEPEDLEVYGLRKFNPSERLKLIEHAIETTNNLGFVVIDGIKDLITSINDEEQATMITSKLLKWSEEKEIHILSVLHQNKGNDQARGHIGTELINKSETVLSVTKSAENKDISIVEAEFCRNKEPDPFAFEIIDGLPVLVSDYEIRTSKPKDTDLYELTDVDKYSILNIVFSNGDSFSYAELKSQIKMAFKEKYKKSIGGNKIVDFITDCKNRKWLIQEADRKPYSKGDFDNDLDSFNDF